MNDNVLEYLSFWDRNARYGFHANNSSLMQCPHTSYRLIFNQERYFSYAEHRIKSHSPCIQSPWANSGDECTLPYTTIYWGAETYLKTQLPLENWLSYAFLYEADLFHMTSQLPLAPNRTLCTRPHRLLIQFAL